MSKTDYNLNVGLEGPISNVLGHGHSLKGISFWTATVFVVGEVAGGGILSLAHATAQAGWSGLGIIVYCAILAAIAGIALAKCWLILEERYPEYRHGLTRKPFSTIGYHAFGNWASAFVSLLINITRIGAGTVFLLLTSNMIHTLTKQAIHLSNCEWIPIVAVVMLLPMWLRSPADFWPVAYSAMISSVVGTVLLIINCALEISKHGMAKDFHVDGLETWASAFGTILFAFGGASAFPNFQNDMKEKDKFPRAVILGYIVLGYAAMGFNASESIIDDLGTGAIITIVEICFFIHCGTVIFIVINPTFLDLEELFNVPKPFSWKRALLRTAILILMTFIGETFPSFGQILDLIGSTTVALLSFVLPLVFYVKLVWDQEKNLDWPQRKLPAYVVFLFVLLVITAIVGGFSSAFSTLKHWTPLDAACYISGSGSASSYNETLHK
ncbi:hypothetical protein BLOT_006406 [Blomia tropicalis]|nr:hypothetical protein BLOT_006406 [Blomia tropicalis]